MFSGLPSEGILKAFAKINLHLRVLNKRDDGYHNILSLMATVGLCDLLKLERIDESKGDFSCDIQSRGGAFEDVIIATPSVGNLIHKAAACYCAEAGIRGRFEFSIEKNIPAGAGLGGGSADAAGVLRLLNDRYGRFGGDELLKLGARIGADVPFCINGGIALCEGKGEIITPAQGRLDYAVVIANNGMHVDTPWAYRSLGRGSGLPVSRERIDAEKQSIIKALRDDSLESVVSSLVNDFEAPVFREHPEIERIKDSLYRQGAFFSAMTGSGSTVIGLFKSSDAANTAADILKKSIRSVFVTAFL